MLIAPLENVLDFQSHDPHICTSRMFRNKRCPINPLPTPTLLTNILPMYSTEHESVRSQGKPAALIFYVHLGVRLICSYNKTRNGCLKVGMVSKGI